MVNYSGLQKSLTTGLTKAFTKLKEEHGTGSIDGVALFLLSRGFAIIEPEPDLPAPRFGMSFNTKVNLESYSHPANDMAYMRWTPGRWDYRDAHSDCFGSINRILTELTSFGTPLSRDHLHAISINALLEMRGSFPEFDNCIFTFVYSDAFSLHEDVDWVTKLNSKENATELHEMLKRYMI